MGWIKGGRPTQRSGWAWKMGVGGLMCCLFVGGLMCCLFVGGAWKIFCLYILKAHGLRSMGLGAVRYL